VLGSGIDVDYPASSADLLARMARTATVLSEYPPGVRAEPHRFPARNRIVVGLSRALVVVEGAERSGSMISVGHALGIGREVFAVPGPVSSPLAEVPLRLIREARR
jgi:DNA processing protein